MKGDKVIVRSYGDRPLIRRLWDVEGDTVYVCSDKNFERLMIHDDRGTYIGFPKDDVYRFDEEYKGVEELKAEIPELWQHLTKWSEAPHDTDEDICFSEIVDIEVERLKGSEEVS